MSRILLVDDSPHAQRMGERILSDEGFEVVTVSNADSALIRLDDVDPDVVLADVVMPGRNGYEICQYIKMSPRHRHVRVILTCGVLEIMDESQAGRVEADGTIKKPFEASALLAAVKPLAEAAQAERKAGGKSAGAASGLDSKLLVAPFVAVVDAEQVRAAVTVALDASMETIIDQITSRVLNVLGPARPAEPRVSAPRYVSPRPAAAGPGEPPADERIPADAPPLPAPALPEPPRPAAPPPATPRVETVRRVTALRLRPGSILGLDITQPEPEPEEPRPTLDEPFD